MYIGGHFGQDTGVHGCRAAIGSPRRVRQRAGVPLGVPTVPARREAPRHRQDSAWFRSRVHFPAWPAGLAGAYAFVIQTVADNVPGAGPAESAPYRETGPTSVDPENQHSGIHATQSSFSKNFRSPCCGPDRCVDGAFLTLRPFTRPGFTMAACRFRRPGLIVRSSVRPLAP